MSYAKDQLVTIKVSVTVLRSEAVAVKCVMEDTLDGFVDAVCYFDEEVPNDEAVTRYNDDYEEL
jgi:hypothetical protein